MSGSSFCGKVSLNKSLGRKQSIQTNNYLLGYARFKIVFPPRFLEWESFSDCAFS